jgi:uncharacterized membrane-anchored protein
MRITVGFYLVTRESYAIPAMLWPTEACRFVSFAPSQGNITRAKLSRRDAARENCRLAAELSPTKGLVLSAPKNAIRMLNKVPQVTLIFWIVKVMSTTVGETGADYLAVHVGLGIAITDGIMSVLLIAALLAQLHARQYVPWRYWLAVVLVSVVGTQITDFLTDKLGISLYVSTAVFAVILTAIFAIWYTIERTLSIHTIITRRRELFYWAAILCTFALGTAAGDLATEALMMGFNLGVLAFVALIATITAAYYLGANAVLTFWIAYILTRPLGASLGDLLSQSRPNGGLGLGTIDTSIVFLVVIASLVTFLSIGPTAAKTQTKPIEEA